MKPIRAALPAVLLVALAVGGCSAGPDSGDSAASSHSAPGGSGSAERVPGQAALDQAARPVKQAGHLQPAPAAEERALIRTGTVALRSRDVGTAQHDVQGVVDRYAGEVTEERTTTDDDGTPTYTRMVLRIPSTHFDEAMQALKGVAELETADTSEEDVTTKLIDTRTRLQVQRRSVDRIATLLDRADSIRDIMAIEAQLSRRQAALESLQRQVAYLGNQTALSTITVSIDEVAPARTAPKDDDAGFVTGLRAGWGGLAATAVALATALGALLPWLVVLLVLGPPVAIGFRAVRRRVSAGRSGRTPSAA